MKVEKDYEEFLELLNKYKVRYCIIGSFLLINRQGDIGFYQIITNRFVE
ncbi:MAG: hypothetical protein AB1798_00760 [Spirochaetota bacterium]